jgi:hypothetical protein
MSIIRSKVQGDHRSDQYGSYEYPVKQHGSKVLPGQKKPLSGVAKLAFLAIGVAIMVVLIEFTTPYMLHMQSAPTNPPLSVATNAGMPPVFASPSLTAKQINAILLAAHSPAAGTGQALYDGSVKSGVDDLFALGVFNAMSKYGTLGVAVSAKSLGDFKDSSGYIQYATWQAGYADFYARAKASHEQSEQSVLDYIYIPGIVNVLDLKKARAGEPDLSLVLATMKSLEK